MDFSISNQTVAFSLCSISLYGSRYVVVDYLIKPEQRTLMGSYLVRFPNCIVYNTKVEVGDPNGIISCIMGGFKSDGTPF